MKVVITGANRGIGLELAKIYATKGYEVIALCRKASEEIKSVAKKVIEDVDVTTEATIKSKIQELGEEKIDILINNAGLLIGDDLDSWKASDLESQFKVNALGPMNVTRALLPRINKGGKIAMVTSRMGSMEDNTSGRYYGYRASKAALNAFGKSLSEDLKPEGIAVALLHPGFVKTRMTNFNGDIEPDKAAAGLFQRIEDLDINSTGGFWHSNGEKLPW